MTAAAHAHEPTPDVRPAPRTERVPRLDDAPSERRADRPADGRERAPVERAGAAHPLRLGSGRPLEGDVQARSEHALGVDLSSVRVHDDRHASAATDALGAEALAAGPDIAFAPGRYDPGSPAGQRLLDHELTHVAEQARAGRAAIQRQPKPDQGGPGARPPKEPFDTSADVGPEDGHVLFDNNSIDPPAGFGETFTRLLAAHSGPVTVELHGYASEAGDPTYNTNLSAHRTVVLKRLIEAQLPEGSVVRLIAHGTTIAFGETPDANRRVGIDLTDRYRVSEVFGPLPGPPSRFKVPELTIDARLLPPPTFKPPTPEQKKPEETPSAGAVTGVKPRITWDPEDPRVIGKGVFGQGLIPPGALTPGTAAPTGGGIKWSYLYADARARGVTLGRAEEATIAQHYSYWLPLSRAVWRNVPGVKSLFDTPDDLQLTLTRSMLGLSLQGDNPSAFELWDRQYDDMRAKLGLPPGWKTPTLGKTWEF